MLILICPLFWQTKSATNTVRLLQLGGDTMTGITMEVNEKRTFCEHQGGFPRRWCNLIDNKAAALGQLWLKDLASVFGIEYLVEGKSGDNC
ncbi:hypothetical protein IJJ27_03355 [bacterium]|nr:hypothetical protein [bacterium]